MRRPWGPYAAKNLTKKERELRELRREWRAAKKAHQEERIDTEKAVRHALGLDDPEPQGA